MKKALKIIGCVLLSCLALYVLLYVLAFCIGKFGWKLFGFKLCENPDTLFVETVYVTDEYVHISGDIANSSTAYVGHTYKVKDDALYIGIKHNLFIGFVDRIGAYSFEIEEDFKNLSAVYLVNKDQQNCIWTVQEDKKYMEKIQKVRLYETVSVTEWLDIEQAIATEEFLYADDDLLYKLQHPTFSNELYFTKGDGYLGVAELDNGEELYLDLSRHYDDYTVIGKFGYYDYENVS